MYDDKHCIFVSFFGQEKIGISINFSCIVLNTLLEVDRVFSQSVRHTILTVKCKHHFTWKTEVQRCLLICQHLRHTKNLSWYLFQICITPKFLYYLASSLPAWGWVNHKVKKIIDNTLVKTLYDLLPRE